jgi:hypothetical protein
VAVPLCSNLVQLAALKQYQGEGDGEDEHTPALFLEAPYRVGKPLRDKLAGFHSARLGNHWRILYQIDESKRVVSYGTYSIARMLAVGGRDQGQTLDGRAN